MIYRQVDGKIKGITKKQTGRKDYAPAFAEEAVRERAAALSDEELSWALDELIKRGRLVTE